MVAPKFEPTTTTYTTVCYHYQDNVWIVKSAIGWVVGTFPNELLAKEYARWMNSRNPRNNKVKLLVERDTPTGTVNTIIEVEKGLDWIDEQIVPGTVLEIDTDTVLAKRIRIVEVLDAND